MQNSSREIDVVFLRVVIGVDGGRSHVPFIAIDGLADFRQPAVKLKPGGAFRVADVVAANDLQRAVVAPFVGIADFIGDGVELGQRLFFGGRSHPGEGLDLTLHGGFDLFHYL